MHKNDEDEFSSQLYQHDAGLYIDVDFYDRGRYPPNALHSDGHQDSLGLCLYFALSEALSGNDLQFMLLDDVVTSVDVGHRRELASLLSDRFSHRQVIVTTHDLDWNKMLVSEGFAEPPNLIRLDRWDIDLGIVRSDIRPVWHLIDDHLNNSLLVAAASELRNWAEGFLKQVCHNLRAPVPYKIDSRYTLDDLLGPGLKRYKGLLNDAIGKARKNKNEVLLANLESLEIKRSTAHSSIYKEVWLINRIVHNNEGIHPTSDEIRNAVNAFREFYRLLHCEDCPRMLSLSQRDKVISCKCGKILWKV